MVPVVLLYANHIVSVKHETRTPIAMKCAEELKLPGGLDENCLVSLTFVEHVRTWRGPAASCIIWNLGDKEYFIADSVLELARKAREARSSNEEIDEEIANDLEEIAGNEARRYCVYQFEVFT